MFFPADILNLARTVIEQFNREKKKIVLAESCTGGLIAAALTSISGSSAVLERGFVSYSNESKVDLLGVLPKTLARYGAVSTETAEAMAQGALEYSHADVALSVTGIAGPDGGSSSKPVGLVCYGLATREGSLFHMKHIYKGEREDVRYAAIKEGLGLLLSLVQKNT